MTREIRPDLEEEGIEVPYERIDPVTLQNMIEEFVTREWAELSDAGYTLDDKVSQVMQQLRDRKVKVVFDFRSETGNIVPCR
jgi:uncharacterized protein